MQAFKDADNAPDMTFVRSFGSDLSEVRNVLADLMTTLTSAGVPAGTRGSLEIVLAEIMNNISEHAYGEQVVGPISLEVMASPCCIGCRITDTGKSMPGLQVPEGVLPSNDVALEDLPEGGFGWFLIRQMTADLSYARVEDANTLHFQLPVED